jgi:hypothetical protein
VDWIDLAQDREKWQAVVDTVTNLRFHKIPGIGLAEELSASEALCCMALDTHRTLRAGRASGRILVGARFSAPVQTGPRAHPAFSSVGTGSFPGLKRPETHPIWCRG